MHTVAIGFHVFITIILTSGRALKRLNGGEKMDPHIRCSGVEKIPHGEEDFRVDKTLQAELFCGVFDGEDKSTLEMLLVQRTKYDEKEEATEFLTQKWPVDNIEGRPNSYRCSAMSKSCDPLYEEAEYTYDTTTQELQMGSSDRSYKLGDLSPMTLKTDKDTCFESSLPNYEAWKFGLSEEPWSILHDTSNFDTITNPELSAQSWHKLKKYWVLFGEIPLEKEGKPALPVIITKRSHSPSVSFGIMRKMDEMKCQGFLAHKKAISMEDLDDDSDDGGWIEVKREPRSDPELVDFLRNANGKSSPRNQRSGKQKM